MKGLAAAVFSVCLVGCIAYRPKPIDPSSVAAKFRARSLSDPGLLRFIAHLSPAPSTAPATQPIIWNLYNLTLAAFYYQPDMPVARAELAAAQAGVRIAGASPNPTIGINPGYETERRFPFLFGLTLDWPIETAGKRGHRVSRATAMSEAARWHAVEVAWRVRSRVRTALIDRLLAMRTMEISHSEEQARAEAIALLEQRLAAGAVSRPELDRARIDWNNARLASKTAEGEAIASLASLASAVGVAAEALRDVRIEWPALDQPPAEDALPSAEVQDAALLHRADVRKALAEYAAAEAGLQLEVAKQYPDVQISPGYAYEEGLHKYTLGASITLPILDQNQGPIAEAQGRREQEWASFTALQATVIGQAQQALSQYHSALLALAEAQQIVVLAAQRERDVRRAFDVGAEDRLALANARVEGAVAAKSKLDLFRKTQNALGALEDAMQQPWGTGTFMLPPVAPGLDGNLAAVEEQRP